MTATHWFHKGECWVVAGFDSVGTLMNFPFHYQGSGTIRIDFATEQRPQIYNLIYNTDGPGRLSDLAKAFMARTPEPLQYPYMAPLMHILERAVLAELADDYPHEIGRPLGTSFEEGWSSRSKVNYLAHANETCKSPHDESLPHLELSCALTLA